MNTRASPVNGGVTGSDKKAQTRNVSIGVYVPVSVRSMSRNAPPPAVDAISGVYAMPSVRMDTFAIAGPQAIALAIGWMRVFKTDNPTAAMSCASTPAQTRLAATELDVPARVARRPVRYFVSGP